VLTVLGHPVYCVVHPVYRVVICMQASSRSDRDSWISSINTCLQPLWLHWMLHSDTLCFAATAPL